MANPRRRTDAASKLLFLGDVIADLVRIALPALAAELDLDRIEPLPTELAEQLRREWRLFATPGYRPFREGMHAWVEEALLGAAESGAELPSFDEMEGTKEAEMTYLFKDKIDAFREEARAEGREEGIQVARREQRDLLVAMAARRFGTPAGRRLADALEGRPSADVLSETGDLILACETAAEFVDRLPG